MLTGVGRPIRPRPKLDIEKKIPTEVKNTTTNTNSSEDTVLLERLFGLQNGERDSFKRDSSEQQEQREFDKDSGLGTIEQIVEVVTSISTKVSSSINGDQMILKLVITNTTDTSDSKAANKTATATETSNSDRKIATAQDKDQLLVDNLRKFAEVRTGNDGPLKRPRNESSIPSPNVVTRYKPDNLIDLEKLKKIADVIARGNETSTAVLPKEMTLNYTLSRDGVPVMTKALNKAEERTDKMMSTTEENHISQARK